MPASLLLIWGENGTEAYAVAPGRCSGAGTDHRRVVCEHRHNIRLEDVQLPEGKENFVKITIKEEYSKTLGRTISLYWKHSVEAVMNYHRQRIKEGIKSDDPVFDMTYPAARKCLRRLVQRVLKRSIHFHLFRHSSATYYATRLNRQELCYRYGWLNLNPPTQFHTSFELLVVRRCAVTLLAQIKLSQFKKLV